MRTEKPACSRLAFDAETLGERPLDEAQRQWLAGDPARRRQLDEHRGRQQEFLRRFPSFESLAAVAGARQGRPAPARSRLRFALVPLTAAAVLTLVALLPRNPPHQQQGNESIKGTEVAALDMAVVRGGEARAFTGQAVREGDKLIFRARVAVEYLSIFSLEASGRVQAIVVTPDAQGHSLAVHLPPSAPCPQGIEVDGYSGHERIVAVTSAEPLSAERIAEWLRTSHAAMTPVEREALRLGPPPFPAQVTTWLMEKDGTP